MKLLTTTQQHAVDSTATYQANTGLLAMQYSYTLPADYDMSNIRRRIATKGHLMDGFPDLVFKAFAYSANDYSYRYSGANYYAPFYLWQNASGITRFLESAGFTDLMQTFGRPVVRTWSVLYAQFRDSYPITSWATREYHDIPKDISLSELHKQESTQIKQEIDSKRILGAFSAYEVQTWKLIRYKLLTTCPAQPDSTKLQIYQVGHLATRHKTVQ